MRKYSFFSLCLLLACVIRLSAQDFFVSPKGNDQNNGDIYHPFATIEHARNVVRTLHQQGDRKQIHVFIREGTYSLGHSLLFTSQDSGFTNSPVIYSAYRHESVSINGGISLPLSAVRPLDDAHSFHVFKPQARAHIFQVDLHALGIHDFGTLHTVGSGHSVSPVWMELFVDKKPYQLARWPNSGFIPLGKVIRQGATYVNKDTVFAQFSYTESQPSTWHHVSSLWLEGYFNWGYADEMVKVGNVDTVNHTITLAQPTIYGVVSGRPFDRWYALNVPEELDTVGEYYIDRTRGMLYFYSLQPVHSLELSLQTEPLVVLLGTSNIQFQHLHFECSRGIGLYMEHSSNILIEQCQFRNLGLNAVSVGKGIGPFAKTFSYHPLSSENQLYNNDGGENNGLVHCQIYHTGAGGVILGGGDRLLLKRGNNYLKNCTLHNVNRIYKTYHPPVEFQGVGNLVSHCDIYNAPSQAILLGGNDQTIEFNNIHHVLLEADDAGAVYYGRDPTERGEIVRYNYFHNLGNSFRTTCVYVDDGSSGTTIYGNVFYKIGTNAVLIGGGSYCPVENNVFVDCPTAIFIDNRLENWASHLLSKDGLFEQQLNTVHFDQHPYLLRYPELAHFWQNNPQLPQHDTVSNNVFYRVKEVVHGNKAWLDFSGNNWQPNDQLPFTLFEATPKPFINNAQIVHYLPGFSPIPIDQIGVH
ncbi:MAG: right-handed parallel beta-helix repeat-containing protein [Microbacter sp.]